MIPRIARRLEEIFLEIAEEYEFEIIKQKVRSDHVHLFVSALHKVFCESIGEYDEKYISQAYLSGISLASEEVLKQEAVGG